MQSKYLPFVILLALLHPNPVTKIIYCGPKTDFSRFGIVLPGDVLLLTDREFRSVESDKRFSPWNEGAEQKARDTAAVRLKGILSAAKTPQEKTEADRMIVAEKARREALGRACSEDVVEREELASMTRDDLLDQLSLIQEVDSNFTFSKRADTQTLRRLLISFRQNMEENPPVGETLDVEE